ncbi:MAG: lipase family protein [Synechococcales bacterium]|nr:lipase family protein [Synechococcales bacterium]
MVKFNRRQILLSGLTAGVAMSLTTDHLRRRAAQNRAAALEAIAEAQLDTDSMLEAAFQQDVAALDELRQLQASVQAIAPTVPYNREISKLLILCNKLTTQQYINGKIDPDYDGAVQSLPAAGDRLAAYTQVASFKGTEDEVVEEVEISRPADMPLDQVQENLQDHLDRTEDAIANTIQEVVKLRRKIPVYFGFVLESAEHSLVLFRGTQRRIEWLNNITAFQEDYPNADAPNADAPNADAVERYGQVHAGFYAKYQELIDPLPLEVMGQLDPTKPCYVSGHSLGGAIATLATMDAALNLPDLKPQLQLYTYASPRVGSPAFVDAFHQRLPNSYRIVNLADVVPLVPPTQLQGIYAHVGQKWSFLSQNDDALPNHQIDIYRHAIDQEAEQQEADTYGNLRVI